MKIFLAAFFGVLVSFGVNIAIVTIGHIINPIVLDMSDPNAMLEAFRSLDTIDFLFPLIAHVLGIVSGLLIARAICKTSVIPIFIVAGIHMLGVIINLIQLPHPVWFSALDVLLPIIIVIPFLQKVKSV